MCLARKPPANVPQQPHTLRSSAKWPLSSWIHASEPIDKSGNIGIIDRETARWEGVAKAFPVPSHPPQITFVIGLRPLPSHSGQRQYVISSLTLPSPLIRFGLGELVRCSIHQAVQHLCPARQIGFGLAEKIQLSLEGVGTPECHLLASHAPNIIAKSACVKRRVQLRYVHKDR